MSNTLLAIADQPDLEALTDTEWLETAAAAATPRARPIPRISIQAFCETSQTAVAVQTAAEDRRLAKAHVNLQMGGCAAAIRHFEANPTPNLVIVENNAARTQVLSHLDALAERCDAGTKVLVLGHTNDVTLYRELMRRGVSEYLVSPVSPVQLMECLSSLYNNPDSDPVGHIHAFVGAKGGVGSSTVCHNVAWMLSESLKSNVVVADMDLAFGTAGLDFNQDPIQGVADALTAPERLDEVLLDRLLTKCSSHLSLFAAPVALDRDYEISPQTCDTVLDVVRQNVPFVAIDMPHAWTGWSRHVLMQADEVVITAAPDLANLRNAKNIVDLMRQSRKNDRLPHLVLNTVNLPKRPEIAVKEFEAALDLKVAAVIEFDSEAFGQAANNGQMIVEINAKAKSVAAFRQLALSLAHREDSKSARKSAFGPLFERLRLKR